MNEKEELTDTSSWKSLQRWTNENRFEHREYNQNIKQTFCRNSSTKLRFSYIVVKKLQGPFKWSIFQLPFLFNFDGMKCLFNPQIKVKRFSTTKSFDMIEKLFSNHYWMRNISGGSYEMKNPVYSFRQDNWFFNVLKISSLSTHWLSSEYKTNKRYSKIPIKLYWKWIIKTQDWRLFVV